MAFNHKEVEKKKKERPVLLEVYKWKDGTIQIFNGGTIPTKVDENGDFEFLGKGCNVAILLDGVAVPEKVQTGVKEVLVEDDGFYSLSDVVGKEYLEKLTEEEKETVRSTRDTHSSVVYAIEKNIAATPLLNALMAADQALHLPLQKYVLEKTYEWRDGRTVVWDDVRLLVNGDDMSKFRETAVAAIPDRAIPISVGMPIAERKYCASDDSRGYATIYRFYIPKFYFK